jgi:hypothetical protein
MKSSLIGMLVEKDSLHNIAGHSGTASWLPVTASKSFADKVDKGINVPLPFIDKTVMKLKG